MSVYNVFIWCIVTNQYMYCVTVFNTNILSEINTQLAQTIRAIFTQAVRPVQSVVYDMFSNLFMLF